MSAAAFTAQHGNILITNPPFTMNDDPINHPAHYNTDLLQQIAHAASDYLCGKRFPAFAEKHGGLDLLEAQLARLLAHLEHGPRPVPGVDVPGPDGDYGGLDELCAAEGVDPRIGAPLLKRAREAWIASGDLQPHRGQEVQLWT